MEVLFTTNDAGPELAAALQQLLGSDGSILQCRLEPSDAPGIFLVTIDVDPEQVGSDWPQRIRSITESVEDVRMRGGFAVEDPGDDASDGAKTAFTIISAYQPD
jgi:hypothetical protein